MTLVVGCTVVLMIVLAGAIVLRALNQGRNVRAGLKIPFATLFFEAGEQDKFSLTAPKSPENSVKQAR